jgi:hypothetical protein
MMVQDRCRSTAEGICKLPPSLVHSQLKTNPLRGDAMAVGIAEISCIDKIDGSVHIRDIMAYITAFTFPYMLIFRTQLGSLYVPEMGLRKCA